MANEVKITGILCGNIKQLEKACVISLCFTAGKKPNGEYNTGFVNCFYYGKKEDLPEPKSRVTVSGWLVDSIVNKGGKTYHNLMVGTKDVKVVQNVEDRGEVTYTSTNKDNAFDDNLPWE